MAGFHAFSRDSRGYAGQPKRPSPLPKPITSTEPQKQLSGKLQTYTLDASEREQNLSSASLIQHARQRLEGNENRDLLLKDIIVGLEQDRDIVDSELDGLVEKLGFACGQYEDLPLKLTGEMEEACNRLYAELKNKERDFDWVIFRLNHALDERSYCRPEFEVILS